MFTAYCYQEGDVHFGEKVPDEALRICSGRERDVRKVIEENCPEGDFRGEQLPMIECVNLSYKASSRAKADSVAHVEVLIDWIVDMRLLYSDQPIQFSQ